MGFDADTTAPEVVPDAPATPDAEGSEASKPPLSAEQRAKAAERARKHRALKRLKAAKTEAQLKATAAEVAAEPVPEPAKQWPTKEEIIEAATTLTAPAVAQLAPFLADTPFALTEKKAQILAFGLAPAAAKAAKAPELSALARIVPPEIVGLGAVLVVFGPPLIAEARKLIAELRTEAPKP